MVYRETKVRIEQNVRHHWTNFSSKTTMECVGYVPLSFAAMIVYLLQDMVVVEVEPIDYFTSEPHFDLYIFVDDVQVYPLNDKPRYGHVPKPENDVRNTFPTVYHIRGFFGELEVRDEVDIYI